MAAAEAGEDEVPPRESSAAVVPESWAREDGNVRHTEASLYSTPESQANQPETPAGRARRVSISTQVERSGQRRVTASSGSIPSVAPLTASGTSLPSVVGFMPSEGSLLHSEGSLLHSEGSLLPSESSETQDGQPTRHTGPGPLWLRLSRLNRGCKEAYISAPNDKGPRLRSADASGPSPSASDLLQGGMMARYYSTDRRFEHRVLKTDKRKSFLYILKCATENKAMDPIVVRITDIAQVYGGEEAMRICDNQSVRDQYMDQSYLNAATAVVVNTNKAAETPAFKDLLVFLAPPTSNLRVIIQSLVAEALLAKATSQVAPDSKASPRKGAAAAKARVGGKDDDGKHEHWWRLDGVKVKDFVPVLKECVDPNHFGISFDLRLRALDEKGRASRSVHPVTFGLPKELTTARPEAMASVTKREVVRLQGQLGGMPAADGMRLNIAMLEVCLFHRWAQNVAALFGGDLYSWLTDKKQYQAGRATESFEREQISQAIPNQANKMEPLDSLCRGTLKATVLAMRQLYDFEDIFARLLQGELPKLADLTSSVPKGLGAFNGGDAGQAGGDEYDGGPTDAVLTQQHDAFTEQAAQYLSKLQTNTVVADLEPHAGHAPSAAKGKGKGKARRVPVPRLHGGYGEPTTPTAHAV